MSNKKLTGTLIPKDNKKAKMHATFYSDKPIGGSDSEIFDEYIDATDQQRNTALANVSNQTANSTTGKMGYKVLDPTKTFAEQVTAENTIYEIRDVFDLGGNEITIPTGCTLKFNGGLLKNGTAKGTLTSIDADIVKIFDLTLSLSGSWNEIGLYPEQYGYNSGQDLNTFVSKIYDAFTSVKFDKGSYTVTEPLYIKGSLYAPETSFYLSDNGVLITDSSSGKHQDAYGLHNVTIDIYKINGKQTNNNNTVDYGLVLNNLNSSEVRVKQIIRFIKGGVLLHGNGQGVAYNRFLFGWIYECDECCIRAKVSSIDGRKGWVNANFFYNFRLSANSSYPNCQAMIWENPDGNSLYYGNVFSQGTLESFKTSPLITVNNFSGNVFNNITGDNLYSYKFLGNNKTSQNVITQSNPHIRSAFWSNAGFIVYQTSMLCKQLVFDSGYLNERFLHCYYNDTSNVDFYVDKSRMINSISYTNNFNYSTRLIIDNTNKKITQNYATPNVGMGIIIDTSEERTFGLLLSEYHTVDIRYLTVDGVDGTDANNQSAGAPITSYQYMSWNTDYKRWRLDSSVIRDSANYIEFTVPTTVSKVYICFMMGSATPSISYFRIFGANNKLRIVPYQNDLPYGLTTGRPNQPYDGQTYFDSDLGKMIVALNSIWVNLDGTALS